MTGRSFRCSTATAGSSTTVSSRGAAAVVLLAMRSPLARHWLRGGLRRLPRVVHGGLALDLAVPCWVDDDHPAGDTIYGDRRSVRDELNRALDLGGREPVLTRETRRMRKRPTGLGDDPADQVEPG